MSLSVLLCQRRLQWVGHIVRMDDYHVPKYIVGGYFKGRNHMGKCTDTWEGTLWRDAIDLPQI
jgi:hypothetical protein